MCDSHKKIICEVYDPAAIVDRTHVPYRLLEVGDRVDKQKGYKFSGVVRAIFATTQGTRVVVELHILGLLHIFNPDQLHHDNR